MEYDAINDLRLQKGREVFSEKVREKIDTGKKLFNAKKDEINQLFLKFASHQQTEIDCGLVLKHLSILAKKLVRIQKQQLPVLAATDPSNATLLEKELKALQKEIPPLQRLSFCMHAAIESSNFKSLVLWLNSVEIKCHDISRWYAYPEIQIQMLTSLWEKTTVSLRAIDEEIAKRQMSKCLMREMKSIQKEGLSLIKRVANDIQWGCVKGPVTLKIEDWQSDIALRCGRLNTENPEVKAKEIVRLWLQTEKIMTEELDPFLAKNRIKIEEKYQLYILVKKGYEILSQSARQIKQEMAKDCTQEVIAKDVAIQIKKKEIEEHLEAMKKENDAALGIAKTLSSVIESVDKMLSAIEEFQLQVKACSFPLVRRSRTLTISDQIQMDLQSRAKAIQLPAAYNLKADSWSTAIYKAAWSWFRWDYQDAVKYARRQEGNAREALLVLSDVEKELREGKKESFDKEYHQLIAISEEVEPSLAPSLGIPYNPWTAQMVRHGSLVAATLNQSRITLSWTQKLRHKSFSPVFQVASELFENLQNMNLEKYLSMTKKAFDLRLLKKVPSKERCFSLGDAAYELCRNTLEMIGNILSEVGSRLLELEQDAETKILDTLLCGSDLTSEIPDYLVKRILRLKFSEKKSLDIGVELILHALTKKHSVAWEGYKKDPTLSEALALYEMDAKRIRLDDALLDDACTLFEFLLRSNHPEQRKPLIYLKACLLFFKLLDNHDEKKEMPFFIQLIDLLKRYFGKIAHNHHYVLINSFTDEEDKLRAQLWIALGVLYFEEDTAEKEIHESVQTFFNDPDIEKIMGDRKDDMLSLIHELTLRKVTKRNFEDVHPFEIQLSDQLTQKRFSHLWKYRDHLNQPDFLEGIRLLPNEKAFTSWLEVLLIRQPSFATL